MKNPFFFFFVICLSHLTFGQPPLQLSQKDSSIIEEIKGRYNYEHEIVLRQDTVAINKFYPDDFVVTNPSNQFIDKAKVLERVKANIIKYSDYNRIFDYFKVYGNTVLVVGSEVVTAPPDASRSDAGQTIHRRFSEVWVKRDKEWMKVLRHANNYTPEID